MAQDLSDVLEIRFAVEETAQWLIALAVFKRILVQVPASTWQHTAFCNSSSEGSDAFFWFLRVPGTHSAQTYMQVKHSYT